MVLRKRKFLFGAMLLAAISFGFMGCWLFEDDDDDPVKITDITISGENTVEVGKTIVLTASKSPNNADTKISWSSSDTASPKFDFYPATKRI